MTTTARIDAAEVVVGDLLWFLGQTHRVTRIDPYPSPILSDWRTATEEATAWSYTLIPGEMVEVLR